MFTNTNLLNDREEAMCVYSDTYKDYYGVRPYGSVSHLSTDEIWNLVDSLAMDEREIAQWEAESAAIDARIAEEDALWEDKGQQSNMDWQSQADIREDELWAIQEALEGWK